MRYLGIALALLLGGAALTAGEPKSAPPKKQHVGPAAVPYRLTDTSHVLLRVKINGKGPFNFIVDTGCPVLIVSAPVGKKLGLKTQKGWATLDTLDLEGGLKLTKVKARVETPFQIEGMNSMGLAGVELHGLLGYTVLAKYRTQFDFTSDLMQWTPLAFEPPPPQGLGGKAATGGMDMMVTLVRVLSFLSGLKTPPQPQPRGFLGLELAEKDRQVFVGRVLPGAPAAKAGLQAGDRIAQVEGRAVASAADVLARAARLTPGRTLRFQVVRGGEEKELTITAGAGL